MRARLTALWARVQNARLENWITAAVVLGAVAFVFTQLHPSLIFREHDPDRGRHGGPRLVGHATCGTTCCRTAGCRAGRRTGTPGSPAFQFYMVVPFLAILALDVLLPYGVAFKLVAISGVVALPVAAWAFGKLSGLRFPGPPMLAVAAVFFLFDSRFTIYGGNIASTMAGEFAFAISLSLSLVYLGVLARGLRTGRHRALGALLLALVGLCHLIPAFFAIVATLVMLALYPRRSSLRWLVTTVPVAGLLGAFWALPFAWRRNYMNDMGWEKIQPWKAFPLWSTDWWGRVGDSLWPWDMRIFWLLALIGLRRRRRGPEAAAPVPGRDDRDHRGVVRPACPRAGSGTPASCPSTTCASTCWPPSGWSRWCGRSTARFIDERPDVRRCRPRRGARRLPARGPGLPGHAPADAGRRRGAHRRGRQQLPLAGPDRARGQRGRRLGPVELPGLRGPQAQRRRRRVPRVPGPRADHGRGGPGARVRPGHVGVRARARSATAPRWP